MESPSKPKYVLAINSLLFSIILLITGNSETNAAEMMGGPNALYIKEVIQEESGIIVIKVSSNVQAVANDGCGVTDYVAVPNQTIQKQILAMALSAAATQTRVDGWLSSCTTVWGRKYPVLWNLKLIY